MLTTLLSTLQTSLTTAVSKPFLIGSVLPIALFLGASFATAVSLGGTLKDSALQLNPLTVPMGNVTWNVTFGAVAVMSAAMIWSGMIGVLLEVVEGKHLGWLGRWLHGCEHDRLANLDRQLQRAKTHLRELEKPPAGQPRRPYEAMKDLMQAAWKDGAKIGSRPPSDPPPPPAARLWARLRGAPLPPARQDMRAVSRVLRRARLGIANTYESLEPAVTRVSQELALGKSDLADRQQTEVLMAIDEARERLHFEIQHLTKERQFGFPSAFNTKPGESALRVLAPTRFGNVGLTIRSYAIDRYGMDLDIFWGRLQKVLPDKDKTYETLRDAKTQVDFVVSLFWLTLLFVGVWSIVCGWIVPSPRAFLAVGTIGPLAARILYLSAVQNYILFADQVRSAVDVFRFDLLTALHVPRPPGNREEPRHWENLGKWIGYGDEAEITYTESR